MADIDEREEELQTIAAIYPELAVDEKDKFTASLDLAITPSKPLYIRFKPSNDETHGHATTYAQTAKASAAYIERDLHFSNLPPLKLTVTLPEQYPADAPPTVTLATEQSWLPPSKLEELEQEAANLWEDYGQCQILFAYIDHLQQAAERSFDLDQLEAGCLILPAKAEKALVDFDAATTLAIFSTGTYDCGICLEPKKGSSCFKLAKCGHIFCKPCLQDFYNNAITEGDVAGVRCLSPDCGKETENGRKRKRRSERTLHPRDLFAIGVEESMVRRYVEMKRKKRLEADKSTVYCPRTWCQGAARSPKYPPIPADLASYEMAESSSEEESDGEQAEAIPTKSKPKDVSKVPPDPSDRLAVCEKCQLAFCRVCFMGWHGPFARCFPRDPNELSAEEKASYDYIRMNTSPCPTCSSPTQKTMGCNHMRCFQCNTHFCYLCGSWLDGQNPYQHFNKSGTSCYQRLWELEEGDEGQGPQDGRGFAGGRGWEQMAIDAAREADEAEAREADEALAREAAAEIAREENGRAAPLDALDAPDEPVDFELDQADIDAMLAEMRVEEQNDAPPAQPAQQQPRPRQRRRRNPAPQAPPGAGERGQAVRNYERNHPPPLRGGIRGLHHRGANANVRRRQHEEVDLLGDDEDDFVDRGDGEDAQGPYVVLRAGPQQRPMRVHHWHPLF